MGEHKRNQFRAKHASAAAAAADAAAGNCIYEIHICQMLTATASINPFRCWCYLYSNRQRLALLLMYCLHRYLEVCFRWPSTWNVYHLSFNFSFFFQFFFVTHLSLEHLFALCACALPKGIVRCFQTGAVVLANTSFQHDHDHQPAHPQG